MFDIQHDSPVPIHEQLTTQIRVHVATEALKPGALLKEYRAFAQELLTNPQVVSRAYAELEADGVLAKAPAGAMLVTTGAAVICKLRLQETARQEITRAILMAVACELGDAEILKAVEQALTAGKAQPVSADHFLQAIEEALA